MAADDKKDFNSSSKSSICDNKVKDHDHITGKYRGSAHWHCNVNFKMTKKIS